MLHHFNDSRFGALADLGYGGRGKWFLNDSPDNSGGGEISGRVGSGRVDHASRVVAMDIVASLPQYFQYLCLLLECLAEVQFIPRLPVRNYSPPRLYPSIIQQPAASTDRQLQPIEPPKMFVLQALTDPLKKIHRILPPVAKEASPPSQT